MLRPAMFALAATLPAVAQARPADPAPAAAAAGSGGAVMQVNTGRGRLITLSRPMSDLFVADDSIADVQVRSPTQLYVFGKKPGETTISATARGGAVVYATTVRVGNNLDSVGQMLRLTMPEANIVATPMNGLILLTGTVAAPEDAAEAERLVQGFVGDTTKVLSRLKTATPLQVNLQVRIAEVSRSFVKNIGVNLLNRHSTSGGLLFGIDSGRTTGSSIANATNAAGQITGTTYTVARGPDRTTLGLGGRILGMDLLAAIDLGETLGQVTTLANPNLTALSGETATFLAGGEIPIPLASGFGAVNVEFKQYGVSLAYTPTVLSDGRISLRVRPEVSQLSSAGAVTIGGTTIPGLTTRRAETTLELGSGQSMMIGGLLSNSNDNSVDKTPWLGDLPLIGSLFRSNAFRRSETELVIVITPYLVKPVNNQADIALPTDGARTPRDIDRVIKGELGTGASGERRPVPTMAPPRQSAPAIGLSAPATVAPPAAKPSKPAKGVPAPGFSN
ncbi:type II and III secretion system protein family protein [Sphingomonas carotinifaciens]|nr:type II and III secretion system protein family protein [Sphingomonas carotinifaciens]MBB4085259.1 pilus assembly protein CpaC [Sphingomonas carotinifaciens]